MNLFVNQSQFYLYERFRQLIEFCTTLNVQKVKLMDNPVCTNLKFITTFLLKFTEHEKFIVFCNNALICFVLCSEAWDNSAPCRYNLLYGILSSISLCFSFSMYKSLWNCWICQWYTWKTRLTECMWSYKINSESITVLKFKELYSSSLGANNPLEHIACNSQIFNFRNILFQRCHLITVLANLQQHQLFQEIWAIREPETQPPCIQDFTKWNFIAACINLCRHQLSNWIRLHYSSYSFLDTRCDIQKSSFE